MKASELDEDIGEGEEDEDPEGEEDLGEEVTATFP